MIVRPLLPKSYAPPKQGSSPEPAWSLISATQSARAEQYLLAGQPDHAKLSGEMAERFRSPLLPAIDELTAKAIGVHDAGWAQIPFERDLRGEPPLTDDGRPQHFMQAPVKESLSAWAGSIKAAGATSPLGEYIVSGHFSRIGRMRIQMEMDTAKTLQKLDGFVRSEEERQRNLEQKIELSAEQLSKYVDLLQFCDVLSLYLCCGAREAAEFPQEFNRQRIRIHHQEGVYVTTPSLFGETQRFYLKVRAFPSLSREGVTQISIHIR